MAIHKVVGFLQLSYSVRQINHISVVRGVLTNVSFHHCS